MERINQYIACDDYLVVVVTAPCTEEFALRIVDEAKAATKKHRATKILFDLSMWPEPNDNFVNFLFGKRLAEAFPKPFKTGAYSDGQSIRPFVENAAVNRGAQFRFFDSKTRAVSWMAE